LAARWVEIARTDQLPADGALYVPRAGGALALLRDRDGNLKAYDDACPHAGASLSAGLVRDGCLVCPWHAWAFDAATGRCTDNPAIALRAHPVRIEDSRVLALIPEKPGDPKG
jgi:nitrite reductase/ring-hydroxylating ferredoxin subunit